MIKVCVDSIRQSIKSNRHQLVVLKEEDGDRFLPIWVDKTQGEALLLALKNDPSELAIQDQDLPQALATLGDLRIEQLVITDIENDTYYAKITVRKAKRIFSHPYEIKCDAATGLSLAVRANSPIFVVDEVMEKASIRAKDGEKETTSQESKAKTL